MIDPDAIRPVPECINGTLIVYNGPQCSADKVLPIDSLLGTLKTEPLDPTYEAHHCYRFGQFPAFLADRAGYPEYTGKPYIYGNFANVSHAFTIVSSDIGFLEMLERAIANNIQTDAYQKLAYALFSDWTEVHTYWGDRLVPPNVVRAIIDDDFPPHLEEAVMYRDAVIGAKRFTGQLLKVAS